MGYTLIIQFNCFIRGESVRLGDEYNNLTRGIFNFSNGYIYIQTTATKKKKVNSITLN